MNFRAIISTLLLAGSSLSQQRVINGDVVKPFSYPFIVSIKVNNRHVCGGSLLSQDTVLTAAHCKHANINYTVHVHRHNLNLTDDEEKGFQSKIKSFVTNPNFNATKYAENDVAIIKLDTPIPKNVDVKFVKLSDDKSNDDIGKIHVVAGWGKYKMHFNASSSLLLQGEMVVVGLDLCKKVFPDIDIVGQTCELPVNKKTLDCSGDSGTPVFIKEGDDNFVQTGLVSYGTMNCSPNDGSPSVYTNIREFVPWIYENSKSENHKNAGVKSWMSKRVRKMKHIFNH